MCLLKKILDLLDSNVNVVLLETQHVIITISFQKAELLAVSDKIKNGCEATEAGFQIINKIYAHINFFAMT